MGIEDTISDLGQKIERIEKALFRAMSPDEIVALDDNYITQIWLEQFDDQVQAHDTYQHKTITVATRFKYGPRCERLGPRKATQKLKDALQALTVAGMTVTLKEGDPW